MREDLVAAQKRGKVPSSAADSGQCKVDFPPAENGVDYLRSVVEHLTREHRPGPRDLKYAVLHLQAAAEVLLKARLQQEHWSLVFKAPAQATRPDFEAGSFESCTTEAAITRLRNIAGVAIDDRAFKALDSLTKSRNALQHYGLRANTRAVESRAAEVLDFLLAFVYRHLLPLLTDEESGRVSANLVMVEQGVLQIESFVTKRENRLRGELKDCQERTVRCPACGKWAMVLGTGKEIICHFCELAYDLASEAAFDWAYDQDHIDGAELDGAAVGPCPWCNEVAVLLHEGVRVAAAPQEDRSLCFACGMDCSNLEERPRPVQ